MAIKKKHLRKIDKHLLAFAREWNKASHTCSNLAYHSKSKDVKDLCGVMKAMMDAMLRHQKVLCEFSDAHAREK